MGTAQKPGRGSLSRRDPSLVARTGSRISAAFGAVTPVDTLGRFDSPSTELLNKILLTLGLRALVTGIALTLIAPTVPVFVGANLLFGVPVVVRYLYRRRTDVRERRLGDAGSSTVLGRLSAAASALVDQSSSDPNRL